MKYWFAHFLSGLVLDQNLKVLEEVKFSSLSDYENRTATESKLKKKYPDLQPLPLEKVSPVLETFSRPKYFSDFYQRNVQLTKQGIKASVSEDGFIIQAIANIKELDQVHNQLVKRLREWYSLYLPELSAKIESHEKFVELVLTKKKDELLKELKVKEGMGAELTKLHLDEILLLAHQIDGLHQLRLQHEKYLEKVMKNYCPNILELAGVTIGAKLVELGKGLKNLALLPASTIQLLGAEKALFRHLKTGSRSPKYGVIFAHQLIQGAKTKEKGKVSRSLADKLSLCARLDYFKGEFKADQFRKELEEKFK
ncbi:MAG: hypothetical protein V2A62_01495 [Candidatus Woesearchaeota archaeon]